MSAGKKTWPAFTIVELLVVIVIIGILATITIVSYTGITQKATSASLQSDLASVSKQLKMDQSVSTGYPATLAAANDGKGVSASSGTAYQYAANNTVNSQGFCLTATKNNQSYNINSDGALSIGGKNLFQRSATFINYNTGTDYANPSAMYVTDVAGDYQTFTNTNKGNRYWYPEMTESRFQNTTYTISLDIKTTVDTWKGYWYPSEQYTSLTFPNTNGEWQRWSWTYTQTGAINAGNRLFGFYTDTVVSDISFRKIKLEVGTVSNCWAT